MRELQVNSRNREKKYLANYLFRKFIQIYFNMSHFFCDTNTDKQM